MLQSCAAVKVYLGHTSGLDVALDGMLVNMLRLVLNPQKDTVIIIYQQLLAWR